MTFNHITHPNKACQPHSSSGQDGLCVFDWPCIADALGPRNDWTTTGSVQQPEFHGWCCGLVHQLVSLSWNFAKFGVSAPNVQTNPWWLETLPGRIGSVWIVRGLAPEHHETKWLEATQFKRSLKKMQKNPTKPITMCIDVCICRSIVKSSFSGGTVLVCPPPEAPAPYPVLVPRAVAAWSGAPQHQGHTWSGTECVCI